MGGCRCSYKYCSRATKNSEKDFHFYHYPLKDYERCKKWILNANKPEYIDLSPRKLKNKVICQLHFETNCFMNSTKRRLTGTAIPTVDAGSETDPDPIPNQNQRRLHSLQVLQSDIEGKVFRVDTSNLIRTDNSNITTYTIHGGNVVPSDLIEIDEDSITYNVSSPSSDNSKSVVSTTPNQAEEIEDQEDWLEANESCPEIIKAKTELDLSMETVDLKENSDVIEVNDDVPKELSDIENLKGTLAKHSKDIALLKKHFQMKKIRRKKFLSATNVLKSLRRFLPPTLHALLSIHLFKKSNNFNGSEKKILTTFYRRSPMMYTVLQNWKWDLPDVETVKRIISDNVAKC